LLQELSQHVQDDLKLLKQKLSSLTIGSEDKSKLESATSFAPSLLNKKSRLNTSQEGLPDASAAGISNLSGQDDCNVESIDFLKDENRTLMELLVESKVRLAEVEGDFLESKRALRRARDKQKELVEQVLDLQGAKKPIP
jgi:hypothetical protein